ncbi:U7 snRNA-associated Sm-like protein LSm11 [Anopheles aquasalis]|uniref:U7 snRNA-associated Sm-like protein LSm11 n=1 Tax=Anopheles aquasalis TaxID=42839 RepID=UPI00215A9594|nr:U7 snRNA-associated Sm-like protein LSm11 [Anopheles aquasalis]
MSESEDSEHSGTDSSSELDACGPRFNPLRALYSDRTRIPAARARLHDNVQTLEAKQTTLGGFEEPFDEDRLKQIRAANATKKKLPSANEIPQRRFLPSQGLIKVERPLRYQKNLLNRLDKIAVGPLAVVKRWMDTKTRVRIYIRKHRGIRGHVSGVIEMFDRHWNLAVSDVRESWRRRKYRYSEIPGPELDTPEDCSERLRQLGISLPSIETRSVDKKHVICTRKVPQMLVLGEQVVLVTCEPKTTDPTAEPAPCPAMFLSNK